MTITAETISRKLHEEDHDGDPCEACEKCGEPFCDCADWEPDCSQPTRPEYLAGENGPGAGDCYDDEPEDEGADEETVETLLREAVEFAMDHEDFHGVHKVRPLSESSFLTRDKGLHIIMQDGSEWTVGIACYKRPRTS